MGINSRQNPSVAVSDGEVASSASANKRILNLLLVAGGRQMLAAVPPLLTYPIVARVLSRPELGVWQLVSAAAMMITVSDLGLSVAVQRAAVSPDREMAHRTLRLALFVQCWTTPLLMLIAGAATLLDLPGAEGTLQRQAAWAAVIGLPGGALQGLAGPLRMFAFARGAAVSVANAKLSGAAAYLILLLTGTALGGGLLAISVAFTAQGLVECLLIARTCRSVDPMVSLRPGWSHDWNVVKKALADGSAQLAIVLGGVLAPRIDLFVLTRLLPPKGALDVVGTYGLTSRVVDQAYMLPKQTVAALMPNLGRRHERTGAVRMGTLVLGGLTCSGMAAVGLNAQPLLIFWLGDKVAGDLAAAVLALVAAASMVTSVCEFPASMVMLGSATGWGAAGPIVAESLAHFSLAITLVPTSGALAVGGGLLVGRLTMAALMWRRALRLAGPEGRELLFALPPPLLAALVALSTGWALRSWSQSGWPQSLAACLVTTACGLAVSALFGVFRIRREARLVSRRKS